LSSDEIRERLGAISEEVVHRDQLVLNRVSSQEIEPADTKAADAKAVDTKAADARAALTRDPDS
jgi:hypothetical protein